MRVASKHSCTSSLQHLAREEVHEKAQPWGFVTSETLPAVLDSAKPKEPKRQTLPAYFLERERRLRQDMASVRLDTSYGYAEAHAKELAMHARLVQCGVEDTARHASAMAHIARAQETFLANLHKRRATTGLVPLQQGSVLASPPSSFLRHRRAPADAAETLGIEKIKARFATFVELQNETRRQMLANELRHFDEKHKTELCI